MKNTPNSPNVSTCTIDWKTEGFKPGSLTYVRHSQNHLNSEGLSPKSLVFKEKNKLSRLPLYLRKFAIPECVALSFLFF